MTNTTTPATPDGLVACLCGGEAELCSNLNNGHPPMYWVLCRQCHASLVSVLPLARTEAEAIAAWSIRVSTPLADNGLASELERRECRHNWRYNGTDRGGSHKGEDCYRCSKCGAYTYVAEDEAQIQADQAALTTKADAAGEGVEPKATTEQERAWAEAIMRANMALYLVEPPMRADIDAGLKAALEWAASRTPSQANDAAGQGLADYEQTARSDLASEIGKLPDDFPNFADWAVTLPAGHWRALNTSHEGEGQ